LMSLEKKWKLALSTSSFNNLLSFLTRPRRNSEIGCSLAAQENDARSGCVNLVDSWVVFFSWYYFLIQIITLYLLNSSSLPLFSVKVVLICSETLGLVKAGFTSGKLKVQKNPNVFALLTRPFFLLDHNNSSATNMQISVFTVQSQCTGWELSNRRSWNLRHGHSVWWRRWETCFIWNWISFVLHMLSQYY
jgi:hypothetical protein